MARTTTFAFIMTNVGIGIGMVLLWLTAMGCNSRPQQDKNPLNTHNTYANPKPEHQAFINLVDSLVISEARSGVFNGVVLLAEKGEVLYHKAFGYRNFQLKDSLRKHDCFQLASVSKMFTAYAIGVLSKRGQIHIDSSVQHYIIDFPYRNVTVRNLLNHTSGLPRYMVVSDQHFNRDSVLSNRMMHCLMEYHQPAPYFSPGWRFNYQNTNYAYLALLVEEITQMPFSSFCRKEIFEPLEMYDSFILDRRVVTDIPCKVEGHIYRSARVLYAHENYINGVTGDKGMYSNATDLLRFDRELTHPTLVDSSWIEASFTPGQTEYRSSHYGFGWRVGEEPEDSNMVYHYGWWNGFKSCFMRFLDTDRTLIILTNRDRTLRLPNQIKTLWYDIP